MLINSATIYTDTIFINNYGSIMNKKCPACLLEKSITEFYRGHVKCKLCWNSERREANKKSICRHCSIEFRPGVEGRYRFCSDKCRFMNKVNIDSITGCWNWNASKNIRGYGTFVPYGKKSGLAHRESYKLFIGDIDEKSVVIHSCDRPICVAPNHLSKGTQKENTQDMLERGRVRRSKLKNKEVLELRDLYLKGFSIDFLAEKFNRNQGHIYDIIKKYSWRKI